jgi:hypothetical protein
VKYWQLFGGVDAAALSYELSPVSELQSSNVGFCNISPSPAAAAFAARMDRMITVAAKKAARVAARDFSCNQGAPVKPDAAHQSVFNVSSLVSAASASSYVLQTFRFAFQSEPTCQVELRVSSDSCVSRQQIACVDMKTLTFNFYSFKSRFSHRAAGKFRITPRKPVHRLQRLHMQVSHPVLFNCSNNKVL